MSTPSISSSFFTASPVQPRSAISISSRPVYQQVPPPSPYIVADEKMGLYDLGSTGEGLSEIKSDQNTFVELSDFQNYLKPSPIPPLVPSIKSLQSLTPSQVLSDEPDLRSLLPDLSKLQEYAVKNGYVTPALQQVFDRWGIYNSLSPLSRNLMNLLYTDLVGFILRFGHPLESYIISFDRSMDDEGLVRALGARIGIYIPLDTDNSAITIFIDKLVDYIQSVEKSPFNPTSAAEDKSYPLGQFNFPSTRDIINMSRSDFDQFMLSRSLQTSELLYQDRLTIFRDLFLYDLNQ